MFWKKRKKNIMVMDDRSKTGSRHGPVSSKHMTAVQCDFMLYSESKAHVHMGIHGTESIQSPGLKEQHHH